LALILKLQMPAVREIFKQEGSLTPEVCAGTRGMDMGKSTPELLGACMRLLDLPDAASTAYEVGYESASQFIRPCATSIRAKLPECKRQVSNSGGQRSRGKLYFNVVRTWQEIGSIGAVRRVQCNAPCWRLNEWV
jgi:hypothetical protein